MLLKSLADFIKASHDWLERNPIVSIAYALPRKRSRTSRAVGLPKAQDYGLKGLS